MAGGDDESKSEGADESSRRQLDQVERPFKTTRERIKEIEERALRRLRRPLP
jgi:DNA-directed RNA polymerase sigma subunit (sigma70/sigma32)